LIQKHIHGKNQYQNLSMKIFNTFLLFLIFLSGYALNFNIILIFLILTLRFFIYKKILIVEILIFLFTVFIIFFSNHFADIFKFLISILISFYAIKFILDYGVNYKYFKFLFYFLTFITFFENFDLTNNIIINIREFFGFNSMPFYSKLRDSKLSFLGKRYFSLFSEPSHYAYSLSFLNIFFYLFKKKECFIINIFLILFTSFSPSIFILLIFFKIYSNDLSFKKIFYFFIFLFPAIYLFTNRFFTFFNFNIYKGNTSEYIRFIGPFNELLNYNQFSLFGFNKFMNHLSTFRYIRDKNSFIYLYDRIGFLGLLILSLVITVALENRNYFRNIFYYIFLLLFISIVINGITESLHFNFIILFTIFLLNINNNKNNLLFN